MKHFIIEITYTAPLEKIDLVVSEHRAYLQTGYERGWLLMSGPKNPRTGGIIIARAPDAAAIQAFFEQDQYQLRGIATYRITEFDPVKHLPSLDNWVAGT